MIICHYMRYQICRNDPLTSAPPKRISPPTDEILVQQNHALRCVRSAFCFPFNTLGKSRNLISVVILLNFKGFICFLLSDDKTWHDSCFVTCIQVGIHTSLITCYRAQRGL